MMKRLLILITCLILVFGFSAQVMAKDGKAKGKDKEGCTTIQDGTLVTTDGIIIETGYDDQGYNYQAHMFNGMYCDAYHDASWCQVYEDVELMMKWNDAWLSNKDCDFDGNLDRHRGYESYIGSGAWLTNHQSGWVEVDGKLRKWTYFVKIVAVPEDAEKEPKEVGEEEVDYWYTADGNEIGPVIWGEFATIQEVYNDPSQGAHGILYKSPVGPGFGKFKPKGHE